MNFHLYSLLIHYTSGPQVLRREKFDDYTDVTGIILNSASLYMICPLYIAESNITGRRKYLVPETLINQIKPRLKGLCNRC